MSALSSDRLKYLCPDTWVARTYGEYLAACSQDQADLISACTDAMSDNSIDELVDEISQQYHDDFDYIQDTITQILIIDNADNVYEYDWSNPNVISIFEYNYEKNVDFRAHCDSMAMRFPSLQVTGATLYTKLNISEDVIISQRQDFIDRVNEVVDNLMIDRKLPADFQYTLNSGFVNFKNLLKGMITNSNLQLDNDDFTLTAYSGSGSVIGDLSFSTEQVIDEMKTNFASAVAWSYGFLSLVEENVSEAISTFEANVDTVITDAKEKFASSVATVKATIAGTKSVVRDFIDQAGEMLGWNKVIDESFHNVDETDVANYTGASPLSAINIHSAVDAVTAVGNTLLAVGAGIWQGITAIGKKLWSKAKPFVMALTDNPVDIAVCDDKDNSFTISNFQFQRSDRSYIKVSTNSIPLTEWLKLVDSMEGKSYSISTYFGDLSITVKQAWTLGSDELVISSDLIFKPKCLNYRSLLNYGVAERSDVGTLKEKISFLDPTSSLSWSKYTSWINSGEIYADDDEDEAYKYMGFIAATKLMIAAFGYTVGDLNSQFNSQYGDAITSYIMADSRLSTDSEFYPGVLPYMWNMYTCGMGKVVPGSVTNKDFLIAACGYRQYGSTINDSYYDMVPYCKANGPSDPITNDNIVSIGVLGDYFLTMMMLQKYDRQINPGDFLYLPYSNSAYQFSSGRYRIKTDAENADIANLLANVLITAIVVLTAIIICKSVVKIFKRRKFMKYTARVGYIDNQMWNGKKLTRHQVRQYIRGQKKLQKLDYISSGFAGSVSKTAGIFSKVTNLAKSVTSKADIDVMNSLKTGKIQQKQNLGIDTIATLITGA